MRSDHTIAECQLRADGQHADIVSAQTGIIHRSPRAACYWRRDARSRTVHAATVALLVGGLAGCGSSTTYLSTLTVERAIAQSFLAQRHIYTRVLCPSAIPQLQGHSFQCNALFDVGRYAIPVTEADSKGHVRWNTRLPVAVLDIKRVTSAIHASVLAQRGVQAQVTCPSQVLQRQGLTFTCSAVVQTGTRKVKPASYPFTVTEVDGAGHVKYVAR